MADDRPTVVAFGEALWDLLPDGAILGGATLNFCYRIIALGAQVAMITRLGSDEYGDRAWNTMRDVLGLDMRWVQRDPRYPTGTVDVTLDAARQPSYFIVPDVAYGYIESTKALHDIVAQADCLYFGTLIQRGRVSRALLYEVFNVFRGRYVFCDLNLRPNCYTREVVRRSLEMANVLKINDDEARELVTMGLVDAAPLPDISLQLRDRYGLQAIVVTLGERGAYALGEGGTQSTVPGFRVGIGDTVGAGDAFAAAFVAGLLHNRPIEEICETGNMFGAAVASQRGATMPLTMEEARRICRDVPRTDITSVGSLA